MMTAYGDVDTAVESMKYGAYDFVQKPFKLSVMKQQVRAALRATRLDEGDPAETADTPARSSARPPRAAAAPRSTST